MNPRRVDVFFYGLFMDAAVLRNKGLQPTNPRTAVVRGFGLRIGERATLVEESGARAYGVVTALTHEEMDELYSDASVRAYRPEAVLAETLDGTRFPALCFNLVVPPKAGESNPDYAEKLRALTNALGFPPDYVAAIK